MGMECQECHATAYLSSQATIPNTDVCIECHEEAVTESSEEEKIRQYAQRGESIPWIQVHLMPAHIFFSHRRHTTIGGLPCSICHGNAASRVKPFIEPEIDLSMDFCVDCHLEHGMNEDCSDCHK